MQGLRFAVHQPEVESGSVALDGGAVVSVFLVDDGSTDGTADAVRERFPGVTIVHGDGTLYWCGGMRLAWARAANDEFDAYLWLNDDTYLLPGAVRGLLECVETVMRNDGSSRCEGGLPAVIVVGSVCDPTTGAPTFGERSRSGVLAPPNNGVRDVMWSFNGNVVLVTSAAFNRVGNLSHAYRHSFGDIDYGIRAKQAGVRVVVATGFLGECSREVVPEWCHPALPLVRRWRALRGPKGISARELRHLMRMQRSGIWWASMVKVYVNTLFPTLFKRCNW